MKITEKAIEIAKRTEDAYSAHRYGDHWVTNAQTLLNLGYDDRQTEAVMRSKWMRWAADNVGDKINSVTIEEFIRDPRNCKECTMENVNKLVEGTF